MCAVGLRHAVSTPSSLSCELISSPDGDANHVPGSQAARLYGWNLLAFMELTRKLQYVDDEVSTVSIRFDETISPSWSADSCALSCGRRK